jgi:hypothetical protein
MPFREFRLALFCAALMAAAPSAQAQQMYKWVDERGQVTYSNTPPAEASRASKLGVVEERVSVYTPDPAVNRAMTEDSAEPRESKAAQRRREQAEIERREQARAAADVQAQRRAAQLQAAYDRCVAERRIECESIKTGAPSEASYGYNSYYGPAYIVGPAIVAPRPQPPFRVLDVPDTRVGINNAPKVGISTTPKIGLEEQLPVGRPSRSRR